MNNTLSHKAKIWIGRNKWIWAFGAALLLWLAISVFSGRLAFDTLLLNITLSSFLILAGLGQTIVITSGDGAIDLSMQYVISVCAFLMTNLSGYGGSLLLSIIAALVLSIIIGFINGIIVIKLHVPPIITTLAVGYICFSATLIFKTVRLDTLNKTISAFAKFQWNGISTLIIISLIISVILAFVLYRTRYGKELHAVGQSMNAARMSGIKVNRVRVIAFMISGFLGGIIGVMLCAYSSGPYANMGVAYSLTSIAAAIVGGTAVAGGKSSVLGTIGGALMLTLLVTLLTLTGLAIGYQYLIQGIIFILILVASETRKNRE